MTAPTLSTTRHLVSKPRSLQKLTRLKPSTDRLDLYNSIAEPTEITLPPFALPVSRLATTFGS